MNDIGLFERKLYLRLIELDSILACDIVEYIYNVNLMELYVYAISIWRTGIQ